MQKLILFLLFINLSYSISTKQLAIRQADNETDIMNEDFEFSIFEIDVENSTDPSTGCSGEWWQPNFHKGKPVCLKFLIFVLNYVFSFLSVFFSLSVLLIKE